MPAEYIGTQPQEHGSVKVSWGRDCGAVGVTVAGPVGWRDNMVAVRDINIDPDNGLDWHFAVSRRSEINDLIRVLRKARDQSFGRDE